MTTQTSSITADADFQALNPSMAHEQDMNHDMNQSFTPSLERATCQEAEPLALAASLAESITETATEVQERTASMSEEEVDNYPMPTPEQVARSMARQFKFRDVCKHQEERDRQIVEGRKMARAETQGPRKQHSASKPAPQRVFTEGAVPAPAKKRRNRNRNKSKGFARAPGTFQSTASATA